MGVEMARALGDIAAERDAQRRIHNHDDAKDDSYDKGELASAAACYAHASAFAEPADVYARTARTDEDGPVVIVNILRHLWPSRWKPPVFSERRKNLVKAGAMIVAEIERLDRLASKRSNMTSDETKAEAFRDRHGFKDSLDLLHGRAKH